MVVDLQSLDARRAKGLLDERNLDEEQSESLLPKSPAGENFAEPSASLWDMSRALACATLLGVLTAFQVRTASEPFILCSPSLRLLKVMLTHLILLDGIQFCSHQCTKF